MEEKKLLILKDVGKLYLKFGIRSVTMDEVAREFGISKKTLYQFFTDKEDLVSQVIDYYLKNPIFDFSKSEKGNAIDRHFELRQPIINVLKYFNNNIEFDLKKIYPDLYNRVHRFKRDRIYTSTIINITEGIEQGLFRKDLDVELIAKLQVGRMLFTLNPDNEIFMESEIASIELYDKVIEYHMHAICTEKGIKYYKKQLNRIQNEEEN